MQVATGFIHHAAAAALTKMLDDALGWSLGRGIQVFPLRDGGNHQIVIGAKGR